MNSFFLKNRQVSSKQAPLVIAEIGINHEGSLQKALQMVDLAKEAGSECVKFQCHVIDDEMVAQAKKVIPGNARESIWQIMQRCALSEQEDRQLKDYTEKLGMIYLSTPFSRKAADRLYAMGVSAFKIGSGECNNLPLLRHIAAMGKPVILSTGMNDLASVKHSVSIFEQAGIPYALLQCTSMYPTPYSAVRLGAIDLLREHFPDAPVGYSDHSLGIHMCLAAAAKGAMILEKHFTGDFAWPGPDVPISMDPAQLKSLIEQSRDIHQALSSDKQILPEEQVTIDFAYASVVSTKPIAAGEPLSNENLWVKRPGTGDYLSKDYERLLGTIAKVDIPADVLLRKEMIGES